MGDESHIFQYEADGVSVLGGVGMHTVPTADNGELPLDALNKAVRSVPPYAQITCCPAERIYIKHNGRLCNGVPIWAASHAGSAQPIRLTVSVLVAERLRYLPEDLAVAGCAFSRYSVIRCHVACRADDQHCPRTALVCIENTHNRCGGCVLSLDYMQSLKAWADELVRCSPAAP